MTLDGHVDCGVAIDAIGFEAGGSDRRCKHLVIPPIVGGAELSGRATSELLSWRFAAS